MRWRWAESRESTDPAAEKRIAADEERADTALRNRRERLFNLGVGAGVQHQEAKTEGARGLLRFGRLTRRIRNGGIEQQRNGLGLGSDLVEQPERLSTRSAETKLTPVMLPPGCARLSTRPSRTGRCRSRTRSGLSCRCLCPTVERCRQR